MKHTRCGGWYKDRTKGHALTQLNIGTGESHRIELEVFGEEDLSVPQLAVEQVAFMPSEVEDGVYLKKWLLATRCETTPECAW